LKSGSGKLKVLLDTKPLIKLFAQEEGWKSVREILAKVEDDKLEAGISVVTLTEIYYKYAQEGRPDLAMARTEQIRYATYLKKFVIDEPVAVKAGEFKGKYRVPIADAFIAASAHLKDTILISDDPEFKKILEIEALTETELCQKFI